MPLQWTFEMFGKTANVYHNEKEKKELRVVPQLERLHAVTSFFRCKNVKSFTKNNNLRKLQRNIHISSLSAGIIKDLKWNV